MPTARAAFGGRTSATRARAPGLATPRNISLTSVDSAKRTVAQGMGFTIRPAVAAADELRDGTLIRGRWEPPVKTYLHLVWRDDALAQTPALRAVLDGALRLFEVGDRSGEAGLVDC